LATVLDIKKLIAWATVQEMTFMLFFVFFKQTYFSGGSIIFILLHGLMSIYMFYIVDIIQKRYKVRSLQNINGSSIFMPKLTKYIWFLILLFGGFPLSAKFIIEWNLVNFFVNTQAFFLFFFCFFVNFLGAILFIKHLLVILYGVPKDGKNLEFLDVQRHESQLLNFLIVLINCLIVLIYLLKWIKKKNFLTVQRDELIILL
jgi:NADH:ubiquinone oxidoreductase subunit 4 (subunit M)